MPCDSTITITVDLGLADRELLRAALDAEFANVREAGKTLWAYSRARNVRFGVTAEGALEVEQSRYQRNAEAFAVDLANDVKRAYTRQTLRKVGSKFGFALATAGAADAKLGQTKFKLTKAFVLALAVLAGVAGPALAHPTIEQKRPCHDERPCVIDAGQHHEEGPQR